MKRKSLSVFIDESGDFGSLEPHCPFYIVSMVTHDQSISIGDDIQRFEERLSYLGFPKHTVHTAPLIRRDAAAYQYLSLDQRKKIFSALFTLAYKLPIHYLSATIENTPNDDVVSLSSRLTKSIIAIIRSHYDYFSSFGEIIIYYDNGQVQLTKILIAVFQSLFVNVSYRKVLPSNYRLFQIADLFCTLELLEAKRLSSRLSPSEIAFFGSGKRFSHDYYRQFKTKKLLERSAFIRS